MSYNSNNCNVSCFTKQISGNICKLCQQMKQVLFGGQLTRKNIPGGMNPGRIIYINATPKPNATKYVLGLFNFIGC